VPFDRLRGRSGGTPRTGDDGRVWSTSASRAVYENAWIRVREDQVRRPDGTPGVYGVVEVRSPAVFVVAVTDDDEILLVTLHRYTTGRSSIEVPAGGSDGEDLLLAAQRELREESGYEAAQWRALGEVQSLNGVAAAPGRVFLATGLTDIGRQGTIEHEEADLKVVRVPLATAVQAALAGDIVNASTVAGLLAAAITVGVAPAPADVHLRPGDDPWTDTAAVRHDGPGVPHAPVLPAGG